MGWLKKGLLVFGVLALYGCYSPTVKYKSQPCLIPLQGFDYKLCSNFMVTVDNKRFSIPKGFITDLASVPRPLWPLFPPHRVGFIAPSIIHDYLYACGAGYSRRQADAIFFEALQNEKVSKLTAYKMWAAVRAFGAEHYLNANCEYKHG